MTEIHYIALVVVVLLSAAILIRQFVRGDLLDKPLSDDDWNVRR